VVFAFFLEQSVARCVFNACRLIRIISLRFHGRGTGLFGLSYIFNWREQVRPKRRYLCNRQHHILKSFKYSWPANDNLKPDTFLNTPFPLNWRNSHYYLTFLPSSSTALGGLWLPPLSASILLYFWPSLPTWSLSLYVNPYIYVMQTNVLSIMLFNTIFIKCCPTCF
jgi:hypothetical protein